LQPFSRHYSHSTNPFLDFLEIESPADGSKTPAITVTPSKREDLLDVLGMYKDVHNRGALHTLTFVTVDDYLWLLRAVSQEMSILGRRAMFYLAAAVSDFFLPRQRMVRSGKFDKFEDPLFLTWFLSQSTKFNRGKDASRSKWTRSPKF
jgi:phosphopantothenate-cysteine ligase